MAVNVPQLAFVATISTDQTNITKILLHQRTFLIALTSPLTLADVSDSDNFYFSNFIKNDVWL
jgi:hypothetical protein